ncbi:MAG: RNA polymerase sigma factor RpoH [Proteobacteria bacterium]|nr:RNA polymerase sigma factor RpoH [Pseudomonadota bacterium]
MDAETDKTRPRRPTKAAAKAGRVPVLPAPGRDLAGYLRAIRKLPLLSAEEELELARRWRETGERAAADRLATSHLRLVGRIAMGYRGYGLPLADLMSEGNLGLLRAIERFDPDRGFRLATYAMWWIRAAIQEYILHSWSLVKMGTTAAQKKLFFNLRRLRRQLQAIDEGELSPENVSRIARELGVSEAEVVDMDRRLAGPDQSLNVPVAAEGGLEWQEWLVDAGPDQEATLADREEVARRRALLTRALAALSERERHILEERRLKARPKTLDELSRHYGVSRERVRQIEARALDKLEKQVRALATEPAPPGSAKDR